MVSLSECIGMSELSEEEVDVIAEHEHVPPMVAAELGQTLLQTRKGIFRLHQMFRDRLAALAEKRDRMKERELSNLYMQFQARYPVPRIL
jgi:hypothetical protein